MMDYKLSRIDYETIDYVKDDEVHCWLRTHGAIKCTVGDVLLRLERRDDENSDYQKWNYEDIPGVNGVKQRYVVVYIDDCGVYYLRRISIKGLIEKDGPLISSSENAYGDDKYVHDELFIENTLMGDKVLSLADFYAAELEKNQQLISLNERASSTNSSSLSKISLFLSSLKKGSTFFSSEDLQGNCTHEYKVISSPRLISLSDLNSNQVRIYKSLFDNRTNKIVRVKLSCGGYKRFYYSYNFLKAILYKEKPILVGSL